MGSEARQLISCDDEFLAQEVLQDALQGAFRLRCVSTSKALLRELGECRFDGIVLDIQIEHETAGLELLSTLRRRHPHIPVIMYSGLENCSYAAQAMKLGAADYIPKGTSADRLKWQVTQIVGSHAAPLSERLKAPAFLGDSLGAVHIRGVIERLRDRRSNILITGESGSGKEVVARLLRRGNEPFVAVDASTIQPNLAESILFGHERGAFTGADRSKSGIFEAAHGGTLFIDEVTNMPSEVQAKFLRVLEQKEVRRLGSNESRPVDFRVIAATNQNLNQMVAAGTFRHDLRYRLDILPVQIPPLREREADIPLLLRHFVQASERPALRFSEGAMMCITAYPWPGNVRELAGFVQYIVAMCQSGEVQVGDLPNKFSAGLSPPADDLKEVAPGGSLTAILKKYELLILKRAYERADGNISQMARQLSVDRSNLYQKLRAAGIIKKMEDTEKESLN